MSTNEESSEMNERAQTTAGTTSPPIAAGKAATGLRLQLQLLLGGIEAMLADGSQIGSVNSPMAKADVVQELSAALDEFAAVDQAVIALAQVRLTLQADLPKIKALFDKVELAMRQELGQTNPQLVHYGLKPKRPRRSLTPEKLVVRTAKANQTRQIRGTKSKKQKAKLQFEGQMVVRKTVSPLVGVGAGASAMGQVPGPLTDAESG
jgi:hypothetical protein